MLAYDGSRYVGQLYLQEYDPNFHELGGWVGERPWADFTCAEPLGLVGRHLTLGCFHVGWLPSGPDHTLCGRGIGTALLRAVVNWFRSESGYVGLLTWALVPGSHDLLRAAGQMPYTVYERFGFEEVLRLAEPQWCAFVDPFAHACPEHPSTLRIMRLPRGRIC
jgi:GNAT superfamily N-acetyltransferase